MNRGFRISAPTPPAPTKRAKRLLECMGMLSTPDLTDAEYQHIRTAIDTGGLIIFRCTFQERDT